ncbi:hypothetical protein ACFCYB_23620 [Streptomyces sp. NPDC056309]|uniref:hypothetical protein n=1 Tax=unclassified Streptomyces TaxID=2593676 RepID=UPI0035E05C2E
MTGRNSVFQHQRAVQEAPSHSFSLTNQSSADVPDYCEQNGVAFVAYFPLGAGQLARPNGPLEQIAAEHDGFGRTPGRPGWDDPCVTTFRMEG